MYSGLQHWLGHEDLALLGALPCMEGLRLPLRGYKGAGGRWAREPTAMRSIALTLLLLLVLAPHTGLAGKKCVLSGSWRSDDGGRAVVSVLEPDGSFLGSYLPAAAVGGAQAPAWPLKGVQQDTALAPQPVFSFLVHRGPHGAPGGSTTAFVGQCYVDEAGEEALHALWLLRDAVQSPGQDWKATRIGTSVFTRIK